MTQDRPKMFVHAGSGTLAVNGPEAFRASVIADAVGMHRVSVVSALRGLTPSGEETVGGQKVAIYALNDLPPGIRQKLAERSAGAGLSPRHLLLNSWAKRPWHPAVPFSQANAAAQEKAKQMQRAFERVFLIHHDLPLPEVREIGLTDFEMVFGTRITERNWNTLFNRFIDRAGVTDDFSRIDIYLEERVTRAKKTAGPIRIESLPQIDGAIDILEDRDAPTPGDRCTVWEAIIADYRSALSQGAKPHHAQAAILSHTLAKLPAFSKNLNALKRSFRAKLKDDTRIVRDRRKGRSGRKSRVETDTDLIVTRMLRNRGRMLQSWQELWDENKLDAPAYEFGQRNRVPQRIQRAVRADYDKLQATHKGPSYERLQSPKINRSWDNRPAGFQFQTDDMTGNHYFYHFTPDGKYECADGRFNLTRGQLLPWMDTRSRLFVTALILPTPSFNQIDIFRSYRMLHDDYGLPPEIHNERGIFERALTIAGRENKGLISPKKRIYGWRDHGVVVRHALHPQGKPIERAFAEIQKFTDKERGYAGRNERTELPDSTKRALQLVKAGKAHPGEYLLSFEEMKAIYKAAFERYNNTPQPASKALRGLTPKQAFEQFYDPSQCTPLKFDPPFDYLLCSHRREFKITKYGIKSPFSKEDWYIGEATGERVGQTVLVHFDFDRPEYVIITDLEGKNPATVYRQTRVDAFGASNSPEFEQAHREIGAHRKAVKAHHISLKETFPEEFAHRARRQVVADPASLEQARAFQQIKQEAETDLAESTRSRDRARRALGKIGARNILDPARADAQYEAASEFQKLMAKAQRNRTPEQ